MPQSSTRRPTRTAAAAISRATRGLASAARPRAAARLPARVLRRRGPHRRRRALRRRGLHQRHPPQRRRRRHGDRPALRRRRWCAAGQGPRAGLRRRRASTRTPCPTPCATTAAGCSSSRASWTSSSCASTAASRCAWSSTAVPRCDGQPLRERPRRDAAAAASHAAGARCAPCSRRSTRASSASTGSIARSTSTRRPAAWSAARHDEAARQDALRGLARARRQRGRAALSSGHGAGQTVDRGAPERVPGRWFEVRGLPDRVGVSVYLRDISERKRKEAERDRYLAELRESKARSELLAHVASELLASDDPQGLIEELCRQVMAHLDCQAFLNFVADERGRPPAPERLRRHSRRRSPRHRMARLRRQGQWLRRPGPRAPCDREDRRDVRRPHRSAARPTVCGPSPAIP